jgi:hypothetical protein
MKNATKEEIIMRGRGQVVVSLDYKSRPRALYIPVVSRSWSKKERMGHSRQREGASALVLKQLGV